MNTSSSVATEAAPAVVPRLRIEGVTKSFGATRALREVTFDLAPGEIHALVGENGAGKSTLIKVITGLISPDSGRVVLDGRPIRFSSPLEARAAGVAAVYQDPALFPQLTVAENIYAGRYPMRAGRLDRRTMRAGARALLDDLGFDIDADTRVAELSVAQCEYVEIARALSSELRLLILDEPTSSLTPKEASELYQVVRRLRAKHGTTIVWISHRMEEIHKLADTVTILRDGRHVRTAPAGDLTDDQIVSLMVGHPVKDVDRAEAGSFGEPLLEVSSLSSPSLFEDVSFTVRAGEIVGIAGLVGAGRSEVGQAIFGLVEPVTGEVRLDGRRMSHASAREMVRRGLAYLPENRDHEGIIPAMGVAPNLALPSLRDVSRRAVRCRPRERMLVDGQIRSLRIKASPDDPVAALSGGNRQKVAIGRWLARRPKVLILDEPTHGIDVGTKAEVHEIIRSLARQQRLGMVLISSDMPELLELSDRILVMCRGRVTAEVDARGTTQEEIMTAAVGAVRGVPGGPDDAKGIRQ